MRANVLAAAWPPAPALEAEVRACVARLGDLGAAAGGVPLLRLLHGASRGGSGGALTGALQALEPAGRHGLLLVLSSLFEADATRAEVDLLDLPPDLAEGFLTLAWVTLGRQAGDSPGETADFTAALRAVSLAERADPMAFAKTAVLGDMDPQKQMSQHAQRALARARGSLEQEVTVYVEAARAGSNVRPPRLLEPELAMLKILRRRASSGDGAVELATVYVITDFVVGSELPLDERARRELLDEGIATARRALARPGLPLLAHATGRYHLLDFLATSGREAEALALGPSTARDIDCPDGVQGSLADIETQLADVALVRALERERAGDAQGAADERARAEAGVRRAEAWRRAAVASADARAAVAREPVLRAHADGNVPLRRVEVDTNDSVKARLRLLWFLYEHGGMEGAAEVARETARRSEDTAALGTLHLAFQDLIRGRSDEGLAGVRSFLDRHGVIADHARSEVLRLRDYLRARRRREADAVGALAEGR